MSLHIHDKTHGLAKKFEAYCNKHGETPPWNVGDQKPVHIRVIKVSPAQTVETIKMVRFTASIYRNQSLVRHVLDCVQYLTHETEKQQALGNITTTIARLRRVWLSCAIGRKEEMRLRYRQELFWTRPIPLREVLYKAMTIQQVIPGKSNRLSKR